MRIETLFAAALFTLPAWAQMNVTVSGDRGEPATLTFKQGTLPLSTITGYPYSGTDTFETTLANGSHMPASSTQMYRDSMGRTRREGMQFIPSTGGNFSVVQILDPVAGYQYVLDSLHQTVHRVAVSVATRPAPKTLRPCRASGHSPVSTLKDGVTATNEWLGLQVIEGVAACGSRNTLTYPSGSMFGNDRPVNAVTETWFAEELGTDVLSTHSQPHSPDSTSALKNVRLEEPDVALFQPPDGYRIVDETNQFTITLEGPAKPASKPQTPPMVAALTGLRYSAEQVLESNEILADGTRLSKSISSALLYRDLMGRTRAEYSGAGVRTPTIEIVDAVAGYRYILDPEKQTAVRTPVRVQTLLAAAVPVPSHPTRLPGAEWLGIQTIDGMITFGERSTSTIPPRPGGNDQPTKQVTEAWFSPQLGLPMVGKSSDPIHSHDLLNTLKNLKFGEPEASLFRVPEGYQIVDDPRAAAR